MKHFRSRDFLYRLFASSILFLIHTNAYGEVVEIEKVTSIKIKDFEGNIELNHSKKGYKFILKGNVFLESKRENTIVAGDTGDEELFSNKTSLKIYGPSIPVSIFMNNGNLKLKQWNKNVFVSAKKVTIETEKTKGSLKLSVKDLSLNLKEHKGNLRIKSFKSQAKVKDIEGDMNFQFNEGGLRVRNAKSSLLSFSTHKGDVNVSNYEGDLDGAVYEGKAFLSRFKSESVKIKSDSASIYLSYPKKGIKITAESENGAVYAPRNFHKTISGKSQKARGWVRSRGTARAYLNSVSGRIYIQ